MRQGLQLRDAASTGHTALTTGRSDTFMQTDMAARLENAGKVAVAWWRHALPARVGRASRYTAAGDVCAASRTTRQGFAGKVALAWWRRPARVGWRRACSTEPAARVATRMLNGTGGTGRGAGPAESNRSADPARPKRIVRRASNRAPCIESCHAHGRIVRGIRVGTCSLASPTRHVTQAWWQTPAAPALVYTAAPALVAATARATAARGGSQGQSHWLAAYASGWRAARESRSTAPGWGQPAGWQQAGAGWEPA